MTQIFVCGITIEGAGRIKLDPCSSLDLGGAESEGEKHTKYKSQESKLFKTSYSCILNTGDSNKRTSM
jgi:hypothetical protein